MTEQNPYLVATDARLEKIYDELENNAYDEKQHTYDYKITNQIIRANFTKLFEAQTAKGGQSPNASYSEPVSKGDAVAGIGRKEKLYRTAIQIFGKESQMNMLVEECAELIQSVNKYRRKGSENILEEIADVEIMLEQARMILGEKLTKIIEIHKENKLDRLAGKLSLKATASL